MFVCVQIMHLRGVRYFFQWNIFVYVFLVMSGIGALFYFVAGSKRWKRKNSMSAYDV